MSTGKETTKTLVETVVDYFLGHDMGESGAQTIGTGNDNVTNENDYDKKVEVHNANDIPLSVELGSLEIEKENINSFDENGGVLNGKHSEINNEFNVGDFVWGKIGSNYWWPGQIYDASDASEYALELQENGHMLVAYFGNRSFSWSSPSQLKPFIENFAKMSAQSNSKSFVNAIQKALDEISRLVEVEMNCSHSPKLNQVWDARPFNDGIKEGVLVPVGGYGKYLVARYEPKVLISRLRNVAQGMPINSLELIVLKTWLNAYYHAKGDHSKGIEDNNLNGTNSDNPSLLQNRAEISGDKKIRKVKSINEIIMGSDTVNRTNSDKKRKKKVIDEATIKTSESREKKKSKKMRSLNEIASRPSDNEVGFVREKLKKMTSMLDTCDDGTISEEVRSKLEAEMKQLLEKVGANRFTS